MRRAWLTGLLVLGAFALGLLLAPDGGEAPPSPASAEAAGLGPPYPRSRAGASLAAAGYQQRFAGLAILRPGVLRERIEAVATPDFAQAMLNANLPGTKRLAAGAIGEGARQGIATVFLGTPLGYRLLSYSPERARVLIWGLTILGNASAAEPSAYFGTSTVELAWQQERWKVAFLRSSFGPTPQLASPRRNGEGFELIELARDLEPDGIAP